MGWAKTLLCTLTHTSVRFQTACTSLSTEKSYCKNRSLIQSVTFTPSVSHLLCNMRIFFTGEEFPFIDSKCENHSYCLVIESKSAWLPSPHLCISTRPSARITGSRGVGSAPGKTLSLPTASSTQHSTAQSALPTQGLQKSNPQVVFFNQQFGPVYYWAGSGPIFPKVGSCYLKCFGTEEGAGRWSVGKPSCPFSKNSAIQMFPHHKSQSRSFLLVGKAWGPWKSKCSAAICHSGEMSRVRAFIILT